MAKQPEDAPSHHRIEVMRHNPCERDPKNEALEPNRKGEKSTRNNSDSQARTKDVATGLQTDLIKFVLWLKRPLGKADNRWVWTPKLSDTLG
ncbi:hypothetical protein N7540_012065 [Penicillium herquei]|nr:hypothetical protein N7540_012065 [Penicillium herquei]